VKPIIDVKARMYDMAHEAIHRDTSTYTEDGVRHSTFQRPPRQTSDWTGKTTALDLVFKDIGGVLTRVGDETVGEMWSLLARFRPAGGVAVGQDQAILIRVKSCDQLCAGRKFCIRLVASSSKRGLLKCSQFVLAGGKLAEATKRYIVDGSLNPRLLLIPSSPCDVVVGRARSGSWP
jgi:hypothetical protein